MASCSTQELWNELSVVFGLRDDDNVFSLSLNLDFNGDLPHLIVKRYITMVQAGELSEVLEKFELTKKE